MKISRLEFVALLLAAVFAAFAAGWFFRGQAAPQPVRVETERTLTQVLWEILMQSYLWMISNIWRLRRSDRNSSIMDDFRTE